MSVGGLAALVQPLPQAAPAQDRRWSSFYLQDGLRLIMSIEPIERMPWIAITEGFRCLPHRSLSRSACGGYRAALITEGRGGVDLETLDRIALNATSEDPWLAKRERVLVGQASEPILELACHWVLKEAYSKALGVGLALPFETLAFARSNRKIVLIGIDQSPGGGWRFGLYRRGVMLIGIAWRSVAYTVTALAPAGRNPPGPLLDR